MGVSTASVFFVRLLRSHATINECISNACAVLFQINYSQMDLLCFCLFVCNRVFRISCKRVGFWCNPPESSNLMFVRFGPCFKSIVTC